MVCISSYVFFDLETTGLPWQERNRTKITELSFVATTRSDIERSTGCVPAVSKLTMMLNPQRNISPEVSAITGLTNEFLKFAPTFIQKSGSILNFLNDLPRPVCLVAHNGNTFDYKIFLTECRDAGLNLPSDILCVDSLVLFRKILKPPALRKSLSNVENDFWPELNVTPEDWENLDGLCSPVKKKTLDITPKDNWDLASLLITDDEHSDEEIMLQDHKKIEQRKTEVIKKLFDKSNKYRTVQNVARNKRCSSVQPQGSDINENKNGGTKKGEFTLSGIYKKLLHKEFNDAHRAENDCIALLECVVASKQNFLPLADENCKKLSDIKPLQRY